VLSKLFNSVIKPHIDLLRDGFIGSKPRLHFPVFEQDFFCEIQESVGFLRNPQDFKNFCRKRKKVFMIFRLKNGSVFDP